MGVQQNVNVVNTSERQWNSVADPGFPIGGACTHGGGACTYDVDTFR